MASIVNEKKKKNQLEIDRRRKGAHVVASLTDMCSLTSLLHLCWTLVWVMDEFLTFFFLAHKHMRRLFTHTTTRNTTYPHSFFLLSTNRSSHNFFFFHFQSNPISISPHRNRFSPCKKKMCWRNREQNFRQGNCLEEFFFVWIFSPINDTIEG